MDHHYGYNIESVQIGMDNDSAGRVKSIIDNKNTETKETDSGQIKKYVLDQIKSHCHIMLGGVAAEHIYDGKKDILPTLGQKTDIQNCKKLLTTVLKCSLSTEEIYTLYFSEVVTILENKWEAVLALSKCLEDKYSENGAFIPGDEAVRIITEALQK